MRPLILLLLIFFFSKTNAQSIPGKYTTNFPTLGMYAETIELNCDSTFLLSFDRHVLTETYTGKWLVKADKLYLQIDTSHTVYKRYQGGVLVLIIKNEKIYHQKISKNEYKKLNATVRKLNRDSGTNFTMPSYKKMISTSTNLHGGLAEQYYKKLAPFNCN